MIRVAGTVPVTTRVPLAGWVIAGVVTLVSLFCSGWSSGYNHDSPAAATNHANLALKKWAESRPSSWSSRASTYTIKPHKVIAGLSSSTCGCSCGLLEPAPVDDSDFAPRKTDQVLSLKLF